MTEKDKKIQDLEFEIERLKWKLNKIDDLFSEIEKDVEWIKNDSGEWRYVEVYPETSSSPAEYEAWVNPSFLDEYYDLSKEIRNVLDKEVSIKDLSKN